MVDLLLGMRLYSYCTMRPLVSSHAGRAVYSLKITSMQLDAHGRHIQRLGVQPAQQRQSGIIVANEPLRHSDHRKPSFKLLVAAVCQDLGAAAQPRMHPRQPVRSLAACSEAG